MLSRTSEGAGRSDFGVSSTVECLPIVHGGIERNSSNARTRGLQHCQPTALSQLAVEMKDGVRGPRHLSGLRGTLAVRNESYNLLLGR